jgi:hypothetical protein
VFPDEGGCVLVPESKSGAVTSAAAFKRDFPVTLVVVPVLGPVEHNERLREKGTVVTGLSTHRASRHFRSYWYYYPEGFRAFADLVAGTWPGMSISAPEYEPRSGELAMFCMEGRITRELYWVGFGFQIWCQLLTHLSRVGQSALVVVDEPEVYLHPDVQRQLLGIIRDVGAEALLATHSGEIIAEADPTEIVMIDKHRRSGERLTNVAGVQRALDAVGSSQNITLTALAKTQRILFVDSPDHFRMLRRFARKLGMQELSSGTGITTLESGGFESWKRVMILATEIAEALGAPLTIGAIYERGYHCAEQIADVLTNLKRDLKLARVLERREIENYLLVPAALDRAVNRTAATRRERANERLTAGVNCAGLLDEITRPLKDEVLSELIACRHDYQGLAGHDEPQLSSDVMLDFESKWADVETRMALVPGKVVLALLRERLHTLVGVTLTDAQIAEAMGRDDIAADMRQLLTELDDFRSSGLEQ